MKKAILMAGIFSAMVFTTSYAQEESKTPNANPQKIAMMKTDRMAKELNLSDNQKKAVLEINMHNAERMKGVTEVSPEEMKKIEAQSDARYKVILNEEQYQKYQTMKKEKMQRPADAQGTQPAKQ